MKEIIPVEVLYALVATLGGAARYVNSYTSGAPFKLSLLFGSAFVAGFSGYMFALLGVSLQMPQSMTFIMAGVGGFMGEQTLKFIFEYFAEKVPTKKV